MSCDECDDKAELHLRRQFTKCTRHETRSWHVILIPAQSEAFHFPTTLRRAPLPDVIAQTVGDIIKGAMSHPSGNASPAANTAATQINDNDVAAEADDGSDIVVTAGSRFGPAVHYRDGGESLVPVVKKKRKGAARDDGLSGEISFVTVTPQSVEEAERHRRQFLELIDTYKDVSVSNRAEYKNYVNARYDSWVADHPIQLVVSADSGGGVGADISSALQSMFSSGPSLTDRLLSPSYAIENNIPKIAIYCGPEPIRQYTKSDGTYFTGTASQLRGYNELQYWEAQGVRLDRIRKSPTVGIPYAISIHSGASPETQEFVYGIASSIDGMATAYGGMRGATGTPFIANQRGFNVPSRDIHANNAGARALIATDRGVVLTQELLGLQGTSNLVGNFRGIEGARIEDIISRVPGNWTLAPQQKGMGIKFLDGTGMERIRIHGPSAYAPAGSNSASGWTARIHVPGTKNSYYDNLGNIVRSNANEGHIPIYGNPKAGF